MQRVRRRGLAGLVTGAVLLLSGCSDPAPVEAPSPTASAPPVAPPSAQPTPPASGTAASTAVPGPSTSVARPEPSPGSGGSVEPDRPVVTAAPKRLDQPTRTAGVQVALVSVRATTLKSRSPGDRSGPGVLVRLAMTSRARRPVDTSLVQVGLTDAEGRPGTLLDGPPTDPVRGSLGVGARSFGTYGFLLDDAASTSVTVSVSVSAGQPVVQFRGRAT